MRTLLRPAAIVEAWFDMQPPGREPTLRALQAALVAAGPQMQQMVKWGNLVFSEGGSHAFALVPHKSHVHLQVFRGASLQSRFPQLEGNSRGARHLRYRYGQPIDTELLADVVASGLALMHLPADEEDDER